MSTYATVPEVEEQPLKPSTLGFKKVVAGALFAAFLLGSLAAVVVAGGSAPPVYELSSNEKWRENPHKHKIKLHGKKFPNGDNVCLGFDNGDCIGVRANLHVGKLVERFDCAWDEDHHVYSDWHME